ncbi:MAG: cytochrome c oxidase subunit 3 family protein [Elusimicrobiota bacterium]
MRDDQGAKIGMWLFLFTEIILFGGLFLLYAAYRSQYARDFHHAGGELNVALGVCNTFLLLTSSWTVAMSISAVRKDDKRLALSCLAATLLLGAGFLVVKYFEWSGKIAHGIYPSGPGLTGLPPGEVLFFGLYFTMTGLHGVHVILGLAALAVMLVLVAKDRIKRDDFILLENAGLYWHLVDVVWIFILPLFYLAA